MAIKAAHEAGDIIARSADRIDQLQIENKDKNDFVSEVDRAAEDTIIGILKKAYPDHGFVGEEGGKIEGTSKEYEWIIDPLDGTTNFLYGIPHYAVSIALKKNGKLDQAVVYEPMRDDLFHATRGGGAFLNNRRIRVSKRLSLENALLATGVPYRPDQSEIIDTYQQTMKALMLNTAGIRRAGYDGFWEFGLHEWDIAAGVLLVQEAGGLVGDMQGGENHMKSGDIVAANPKVFKDMIKRLHGKLISWQLPTFFATVGPIDIAVVFAGLTSERSAFTKRKIALKGVMIATGLLLIFALLGEALLSSLGITLPALRTAGGILLLLIGIDMVFARHSGGTSATAEEVDEAESSHDISVFPLATPLIAGPGAIGAVILLMANVEGHLGQQSMVILGLLSIMLMTYVLLIRRKSGASCFRGNGLAGYNPNFWCDSLRIGCAVYV
ncbi:Inositol-1-monophosphatase [Nymphon striatum]|nr:Inositol-1-monophosphatase [Nymphon striatum]